MDYNLFLEAKGDSNSLCSAYCNVARALLQNVAFSYFHPFFFFFHFRVSDETYYIDIRDRAERMKGTVRKGKRLPGNTDINKEAAGKRKV